MPNASNDAPELPFHVEPAARARKTDPETSHEAAASLSAETLTKAQNEVLVVLCRLQGADDARLIDFLSRRRGREVSRSGTETRRGELVRKGLVRDSGRRTRMPSGRRACVWELTAEGEKRAMSLIAKEWGLPY